MLYLPPSKEDTPETIRFVTEDLPRFYAALDRAVRPDSTLDTETFRAAYLRSGTAGLRAFDALTIGGAERLSAVVQERRGYYDAIRPAVLALHTDAVLRDSVRSALARFEALYPDASFPDVTFVVGRLNTGGTVSSRGLLIGVELFTRGPGTPTVGFTAWQRAKATSPEALPHIVVHEVVHAQQRLRTLMRPSLLSRALIEGGADFVASLATGRTLAADAHTYGMQHEAEVWRDFAAAMNGKDLSGWFYGTPTDPERPADLGYFLGYRIAEAYYGEASDKKAAIRAILRLRDPARLLRESGYAERFAR